MEDLKPLDDSTVSKGTQGHLGNVVPTLRQALTLLRIRKRIRLSVIKDKHM